jgi:predicted DNA-binding protein YlxM (UPF0122 family)
VYDVKVLPLTDRSTTQPLTSRASQERLLDVYGAVLTEHQREACRLHLHEDWSFTEIAEHFSCTRSGAHDLVRRGLAQLEHLETRLGHAAELDRRDRVEAGLRARLTTSTVTA